MPKTVTLTKIPLTNAMSSNVQWTLTLRGLQYDEQGDPLPNQTVADRLHAEVRAQLARSDDQYEAGSGRGLIKAAVVAGALTLDEGTALKAILKKLYDYYLSEYE